MFVLRPIDDIHSLMSRLYLNSLQILENAPAIHAVITAFHNIE